MKNSKVKKLGIVIPMYNEEVNAERCLKNIDPILKNLKTETALFVIDDGSIDRTYATLKRLQKVFPFQIKSHKKNYGYRKALSTGLEEARKVGCDYVLFMDTNPRNDPTLIPLFVEKLQEGFDLVKCSRYLKGVKRLKGIPFYQYAISRIGNLIAASFFRINLKDCTNQFRAIRIDALNDFLSADSRFPIMMEELYHLKKQGAEIAEIPQVQKDFQSEWGGPISSPQYSPQIFWSYLKYPITSLIKEYAELGPYRAKLCYDFLLSFVCVYIFSGIFNYFMGMELVSFPWPFAYSASFLLLNYVLGIYGGHGQISSFIKTILLGISAFVISGIFHYFSFSPFYLTVLALFVWLGTSLPRIFFALSLESSSEVLAPIMRTDLPTLIIGGARGIGLSLAEELVNDGKKVKVFDVYDLRDEYQHFLGDKVEYIQGVITDISKLTKVIKDSSSVVYAGPQFDFEREDISGKEETMRKENLIMTNTILSICSAFQIKKFVLLSTLGMYRRNSSIDEHSEVLPIDLYSKLCLDSEIAVMANMKMTCLTVLRLPYLFGAYHRSQLETRLNQFVLSLIRDEKKEENFSFYPPYGIHYQDAATAIRFVLESVSRYINREIFNVGNSEMKLTPDIFKKVLKRDVPEDLFSFSDVEISFKKIKSKLQFVPSMDTEKSLAQIIDLIENDHKALFYMGEENVLAVNPQQGDIVSEASQIQ